MRRRPNSSTAVSKVSDTPAPAPDVPDEDELDDEEADLCVGDLGYDYGNCVCSECGADLTSDGLCGSRSPRCPFTTRFQDEIVPGPVWRELRQVVANARSRKAYRFGSRGYHRVIKSTNAVIYADEYEAGAAGYEVQDD